MSNHDRSSILFIGAVTVDQARAVKSLEQTLDRRLRPILFHDAEVAPEAPAEIAGQLITCAVNFNNPAELELALAPYVGDIMAVSCKDDASATNLGRLVPHLRDVPMPTPEALLWSTNKTHMRAKLQAHDASLSPKFMVAIDNTLDTIQRIEETIGYPVIVKPASLTSSLLVTACHNRRQLIEAFRRIARRAEAPQILVEQLMEHGKYYSIDAYIDTEGGVLFTPPVHYTTGRDIGFDDFFGYMRTAPAGLSDREVQACERVAAAAIKALKLTASTCHVELMLTAEGWKIIELGPRLGGFRHELYINAYGINHALNDLLVRSGRTPVIPKIVQNFSAALQFYARDEGVLQEVRGLETINSLESLQRLAVLKEPGEPCLYAKHGGSPVLEVVLCHKDQKQLQLDIQAIENAIDIKTTPAVIVRDNKLTPAKARV